MATTVFRIEKHKSFAGINKAGAHQHRLMETKNADPQKKHLNKILKGNNNLSLTIKTVFERNNIKPRKNAVLAIDGLLTLSPEAFKTKNDIDVFKREGNLFLQNQFGGKYVSGVYHGDETSPHIQFTVVPVLRNKKGAWGLNAREMFNKESLTKLQKDFYAHMHKFFPDLEPPKHGSKRKHTEIAHFYHKLDELQGQIKLEADLAIKQLKIDCKSALVNNLKPILDQLEKELGDKARKSLEDNINKAVENSPALNSFVDKIKVIASESNINIKNDDRGSLSTRPIKPKM